MEILAPAGSFESFFAGLDNGADAFYAGLKRFNARALAPNFTIDEMARLIEYTHNNGKKLYVVLNGLVLEHETPRVLNTLAALNVMQPDALIIQDFGIARLALRLFPKLRLHASTLMTTHNSAGAETLWGLGFKRVNLARECTFDEIAMIKSRSDIEIEVFVHGAICFSYSGLCLMSSSLGGKSSLRGQCTQPCRRIYKWGRENGSLFSCNDMSGIKWAARLKQAGVNAIKIEGRMKGPGYVGNVVAAYRTVLDAAPGDEGRSLEKGMELLKKIMSRRNVDGFFPGVPAKGVLEPHLSGASGKFLGRIVPNKKAANLITVKLKNNLSTGDRVRVLTDNKTRQHAFLIKEIRIKGRFVQKAKKDDIISLKLPVDVRMDDMLFKVDEKTDERRRIQKEVRDRVFKNTTPPDDVINALKDTRNRRMLATLPFISKESLDRPRPGTFIKLKTLNELKELSRATFSGVIIPLNSQNVRTAHRERGVIRRFRNRIYWNLKTIIQEHELEDFRRLIRELVPLGCAGFTVSNIAHFDLLKGIKGRLIAEYQLNVLNRQAMLMLTEMGCQAVEVSVETTEKNLNSLISGRTGAMPWMVVYSYLPLFTSRLIIKQDACKRNIISPMGEFFKAAKSDDMTIVRNVKPFSLAGFTKQLDLSGVMGKVIDFTTLPANINKREVLDAFASSMVIPGTTTFNVFGNIE